MSKIEKMADDYYRGCESIAHPKLAFRSGFMTALSEFERMIEGTKGDDSAVVDNVCMDYRNSGREDVRQELLGKLKDMRGE